MSGNGSKAANMCSNCSGDDLSPEMFSTFDVSSPSRGQRFADERRKKRKRYGTIAFLLERAKSALTLAIMRISRRWRGRSIIESVDRADFVNLNFGSFADRNTTNTRRVWSAAGLIDVRVSADSIVEVYSAAGPIELPRDEFCTSDGQFLSSWEESFAERSDLRQAMRKFRRARRMKYLAAYGAFLMFAAIAVWCVVR